MLKHLIQPLTRKLYCDAKLNKVIHQSILKALGSHTVNVIVDIGANEGAFTSQCKTFFPNAKVFAIEPVLTNYCKLV
jgi:hypothetical protein